MATNKLPEKAMSNNSGASLIGCDKIRKFEMRSLSNAPKVIQVQQAQKHDQRKRYQQPRLAGHVRHTASHQTGLCQIPAIHLHSQCATNALANTQRPTLPLHMDNTTRRRQQRTHTLLQSYMSKMANLPLIQRYRFSRPALQQPRFPLWLSTLLATSKLAKTNRKCKTGELDRYTQHE